MLTSCAVLVALASCSDTEGNDGAATTPTVPVTEDPADPAEPTDTETPTTTEAPTDTETSTGTETSTTTEEPTQTGGGSGTGPEDLAGAMLGAEALGPPDEPREESEGVVEWRVPEVCAAAAPEALDMSTITQGTGEFEETVGVHQVAVFEDADAAMAATDDLVAALDQCAEAGSGESVYVLEDIAVGAQGAGLATDYYGTSVSEDLDDAVGTYLALTRRGNAVTLVSAEGGESTVGAARERVVEQLAGAWELLCGYDSQGC